MITRQIGEPLLHSVICGLLLFQYVLVTGLKMKNVSVPESGLHGGAVTLKCVFLLESDDQLHSLKWYKNEDEFYRFLPDPNTPVLTFPISGFTVQTNRSNIVRSSKLFEVEFTLRNLTLNATGIYRCEILAETTFQTIIEERNFTVIVPPDPESPRINNISSVVRMGDTISGNCTSFRSRPPAQLTFHINDEKVDGGDLKEYRPVSENGSRGGESMQLFKSILGIRLQVDNKHFRHGIVSLKCVATIGKLRWVTEKIISHKNYHSQISSPSQHSFGTRSEGDRILVFAGLLSFSLLTITFLRFQEIMD